MPLSGRCRLLLALVLATAGTSASFAGPPRRVLERVGGKFGALEVYESEGLRVLASEGSIQGAIRLPLRPLNCGLLIEARDYVGLIPYYRPHARHVLIIGLGAGLQSQALEANGLQTLSVEIDAAVVQLAREYFHYTGEVAIADGHAFLASTPRRFDAIVLDAFVAEQVPEHLTSESACELMAKRLNPAGLAVLHLIGDPRARRTREVMLRLRRSFEHVVLLQNGFGSGRQHLYLFASRNPLVLDAQQRFQLHGLGFMGDELVVETDPDSEVK